MPVFTPDFVAGKICKALGLKNVVDLDIRMHMKEVVSITVKYYPDREYLEKIVPLLKEYTLIPNDKINVEITTVGDKCRKYMIGEPMTAQIPPADKDPENS